MSTKRMFALILVSVLVLCLCACGNSADSSKPTAGATEPTTKATEPTNESTEPSAEETAPTYVVTVVDQDNAPVVGAWVQLCLEACVPAMTDENGVANFYLEENEYKVGFTVMPAGYEYVDEQEAWYFEDGENTITIVIKKAD